MDKIFNTVVIDGGASGLFCAAHLNSLKHSVLIIERGERLGRKLSSTGNGQGNVTNINFGVEHYFTSDSSKFNEDDRKKIAEILSNADDRDFLCFLEELGGLFEADERGRVYPTGRQASAITDLLRFYLEEEGVQVRCSTRATKIERFGDGFIVTVEALGDSSASPRVERIQAKNVVVCAGGKAAKNFGTDGTAYALVKGFSHTVTPLYPSLVQIKCDSKDTKILKGIRAANVLVQAYRQNNCLASVRGDVIFTDYGVSGDAIFRISSYITEWAENGQVQLKIDFLPDVSKEKLENIVRQKTQKLQKTQRPFAELLCGILNNQIGRVVMKRAEKIENVVKEVKTFSLSVTGTLGFDYAQVTRGGIPLREVTQDLESKYQPGLYFAGEILDVDGECGGYNLQWAYSSAKRVAGVIQEKEKNSVKNRVKNGVKEESREKDKKGAKNA